MDPSALPTDNLYKFTALSGLAFIGFLTWLRWRLAVSFREDVAAVRIKQAKATVALEQLSEMNEIAKRREADVLGRYERLKERSANSASTAHDQAASDQLRADLEATFANAVRLLQDQYPVREAYATLNAEVEALQARKKRDQLIGLLTTAALVLAMVWAASGFTLWYTRLQQPLDRKVRLEAELAILELTAKKTQLEADLRVRERSPDSP